MWRLQKCIVVKWNIHYLIMMARLFESHVDIGIILTRGSHMLKMRPCKFLCHKNLLILSRLILNLLQMSNHQSNWEVIDESKIYI